LIFITFEYHKFSVPYASVAQTVTSSLASLIQMGIHHLDAMTGKAGQINSSTLQLHPVPLTLNYCTDMQDEQQRITDYWLTELFEYSHSNLSS